MRNGVCVKCSAAEVYSVPARSGTNYRNLNLGFWVGPSPQEVYLVCAQCGYTEQYMLPDVLPKIREKGRRIPPRG